MRRIAITTITIGIWVIFAGQGQPEKRVVQADSTANAQKPAVSEQNQHSPRYEAIQDLISQELRIQEQNAEERQAQENHANQEIRIEGKLVKYTRALVYVGILQALVLLLTVGVLYRQTTLQEIDKKQWVTIENGQVRNRDNFLNDPVAEHLNITLDVVNPTNYPLTLNTWSYSLGSRNQREDLGITLIPHSPCSVMIPDVSQTREQNAQFMQDKLVLSISVKIVFTDARGKKWRQSFGKMCLCGLHVADFYRNEFVPPDTMEKYQG